MHRGGEGGGGWHRGGAGRRGNYQNIGAHQSPIRAHQSSSTLIGAHQRHAPGPMTRPTTVEFTGWTWQGPCSQGPWHSQGRGWAPARIPSSSQSSAISAHQFQSQSAANVSGHPRQSRTCSRGNQWQSVAISGNHAPARGGGCHRPAPAAACHCRACHPAEGRRRSARRPAEVRSYAALWAGRTLLARALAL